MTNKKMRPLRLVWMCGNLAEREWLDYLLSDFEVENVVPEAYPIPLTDRTIYVVSTNIMRLSDLPDIPAGCSRSRTGSVRALD